MRPILELMAPLALVFSASVHAQASAPPAPSSLDQTVQAAQDTLRQTFTNLRFEDFGPSPIKGPVYQASAGGRILYFAPESGHLLFAAVYDRNGLNLTALAQDDLARKKLAGLDRSDALALGPPDAPTVIEFTDPDCPYCQALERFWQAKSAEGKRVRRLVYFVSGIHPQAAAKAEHILCSPDKEVAFKALYAGHEPAKLLTCAAGHDKVSRDALAVRNMGVSGTPTLIVGGKLISGFQQAELEAFLQAKQEAADARP